MLILEPYRILTLSGTVSEEQSFCVKNKIHKSLSNIQLKGFID